jgi:glycosyltransferase involved in cell wall biosynthesis/GT2 family glycosyltransferase
MPENGLDPSGVDVIVAVYGAVPAFSRCLASVRAHTDLTRHRLVVVADGEQPAEGEALLSGLLEAPGIVVLRQAARRGFVAAVNRGMAVSRRDVVLLNSDTEVTSGWVEKLHTAATSAPGIATVTPFSNDATICSLPRWLVANELPAGHDVDSFGAVVEHVARRDYPRLPTGVGVCLYVTREALDRLGAFDERAFGLGYGEESEFCARATAAGYVHVLADDTFVFHQGQRSFGATRRRREAAAQRIIRRRHPGYWPAVASFVREDPLREARARVVAALTPPRRPVPAGSPACVLHVVHGWPPFARGGTEHYAASLARRQAAYRRVAVLARLSDPTRAEAEVRELLDSGVRVCLTVNNFTQRNPWVRNAFGNGQLERAFGRLIDEERPDLVHIHHLAGHGASLPRVAAKRGRPVLMQVQDWWGACARANLVDGHGQPCPGPTPARCAACLPLTALPAAPLLNRLLHRLRRRVLRRAFAEADRFVAGSRFIAGSLRDLGTIPVGAIVDVVPYGVERGAAFGVRRSSTGSGPVVFGVVGALMPHKGVHVAVEAFSGMDPARARLEVWGDAGADLDYVRRLERSALSGPVQLRGRFDEADRGRVFAGLDVLLVPSIGLESFGLVAREAIACGVPVLASRRGAFAEFLEEGAGGVLVEPGDVAAWRAWILRLCAEPGLLDAWRRALPPVKDADRHAEEIEKIYAELLGRRERR